MRLNSEEISQARKILGQARETALAIQDESGKASIMRDIAVTQAKTGEFPAAVQTASAISNDYLKVNALAAIAHAQVKAGNPAAAARIFQHGSEIAFAMQEDSYQSTAMRDIARAQLEAGDVKGSLETAAFILDDFEKLETLLRIWVAQVKAGDRAGAATTFQRALETTVSPRSDISRARTWEAIAAAQAKVGNLKDALQTVAAIRNDLIKARALNDIALVQFETGDLKGALQTASLQDERGKRFALNAIAVAQARAGDVEGAHQTVAPISDDFDKMEALGAIAVAQAKGGDVSAALQTVDRIMYYFDQIEAWREIATAQAAAGDRDGARTTFQRALQLTPALRGDAEGSATAIAVAQAMTGDVDGAIQALAVIKDDWSKAKASEAIARAQAIAGDLKGALAWARNRSSPLIKSRALLGVAEGILQAREQRKSSAPSLLHDSRQQGWISVDGVHQSLLAKLTGAKRKLEAGEGAVAKDLLNAFLNEVQATACPGVRLPGRQAPDQRGLRPAVLQRPIPLGAPPLV